MTKKRRVPRGRYCMFDKEYVGPRGEAKIRCFKLKVNAYRKCKAQGKRVGTYCDPRRDIWDRRGP